MRSGQPAAATGRPSDTWTPRPTPYDAFERMLIGGVSRGGRSGTVMSDHDPYSGDTLVEIPVADVRDVDEAYRAAESARVAWANALPQERRDVLERAAHIMESRKEEIVDWLIKESCSTHAKAVLEWEFAHNVVFEANESAFPLWPKFVVGGYVNSDGRAVLRPWTASVPALHESPAKPADPYGDRL